MAARQLPPDDGGDDNVIPPDDSGDDDVTSPRR